MFIQLNSGKYEKFSDFNAVKAACFCVFYLSSFSQGSAAVLEETFEGQVLPMERTSIEDKPEDNVQPEVVLTPVVANNAVARAEASSSKTAVILDADPAPVPLARRKPVSRLPKPRVFTASLSSKQMKMRDLAVSVAHRFASSPGVVHAGLDKASFVALFTTMIHRESNFQVRAVSSAGAKGLGQLMPGTARDLGVCDVFSPQDNLQGAATYLSMMLEQFGNPSMALAAYNAGPGAVSRHGGIPPFRETRQYVADIMHAARSEVDRQPRSERALAYQADGFSPPEPSPFAAILAPNLKSAKCDY